MRNLKQLADRLGWLPADGGWTCQGQWYSLDEATLRAKWDSAQVLCVEVASTRKDFEGLAAGLSTSAYKQLKLDGQSQKEDRKVALNAALGVVWHEEYGRSAFQVGDTCVRCGEAVENLEHVVHHCPHLNKERRESGLPTHALEAPACVRLHGLFGRVPPPPTSLLWSRGRESTLFGRIRQTQ
eukprot:1608076-Amphidinium_carterae.1